MLVHGLEIEACPPARWVCIPYSGPRMLSASIGATFTPTALLNTHMLFPSLLSSWCLSWGLNAVCESEGKKDYLLGGMDCMIFSALFLSSTFKVRRYLGVLSLNLVVLVFLFFLMVILSAWGRCFCSLLMILMNSFRSLISFGYGRGVWITRPYLPFLSND